MRAHLVRIYDWRNISIGEIGNDDSDLATAHKRLAFVYGAN